MTQPYGSSWLGYVNAGWPSVLPLPPRSKTPPPVDTTGRSAKDPTPEQMEAWATERPDANVALRMPPGLIALDYDAYHEGAPEAWQRDIELLGPLPATWVCSSRADGSGKRLYRVPDGTKCRGKFAWGEIIQRHHRYVMAPPSVNGDDGDREVFWVSPDGEKVRKVPRLEEIPELPEAWLEALRAAPVPPPFEDLEPIIARLSEDWSEPVKKAMAEYEIGFGSRYDSMVRVTGQLANYEYARHPGASEAMEKVKREYIPKVADSRGPRAAVGEVSRAIAGARQKAARDCKLSLWTEQKAPQVNLMPPALTKPESNGQHSSPQVPQPEPERKPLPVSDRPEFPDEIFPKAVRDFIAEKDATTKTPRDFYAAGVLAVVGGAIGGQQSIYMGGNWFERPCFWVALVGASGTGKNPAVDTLMWQLRQMDQDWRRNSYKRIQEWEQADKKTRGNIPEVNALCIDNFTMEKALKLLSENQSGLIHARGELTTTLSSFDMYRAGGKGGIGSTHDMKILLDIYNSATITVDRQSYSFAPIIPKPFMCFLGGIQPAFLYTMAGRHGFAARFNYAFGNRSREATGLPPRVSKPSEGHGDWNAIVRRLVDFRGAQRVLQMKEDAWVLADKWSRGWNAKFDEARTEAEEEAVPKLEAMCYRAALALAFLDAACEEAPTPKFVSKDQIERAIVFTEKSWELTCRVTELDDGTTDRDESDLHKVEALILCIEKRRATKKELSAKWLRHSGPRWLRGKETAFIYLWLEKAGYDRQFNTERVTR